jgi:hypothetical protein
LRATELIRLSIGIENQVDASGDLRPLLGKASALYSISRHQGGYVCFYRHDLPPQVRRQLEALDAEAALKEHALVRHILARHAPCDQVFAGKGYYFAHCPSSQEYPDAVLHHEGCFVVLSSGEPVCWAWTANESEAAAELAVETVAEYRRRGYARQAAAAWAAHVLGKGKVAFYSHEACNLASEALARSLGVVHYAVVTTYERKVTSHA